MNKIEINYNLTYLKQIEGVEQFEEEVIDNVSIRVDYEPGVVDSILNCLDICVNKVEELKEQQSAFERYMPRIKTVDYTVKFIREDGTVIDEIGGDFFEKIKDTSKILNLMCII